ncbi:DUF4283 domain protein [Medicago truncatula]|uniref:DUF4283 domain protein n=1 Tax=Medicago truncatula TaxID=3880 RepID=A0A072U9C6_MEDTR|nr:DUF4283 domain protein [Medicago truncatula]
MDNLFLSRKRNRQGYVYGFVRYVNVRDTGKLLKALNNVTLGNFRVWAKVARFKMLYGEAIPVIRTRITDAGFDDLDIIPLGADKVYIRCFSNTDVMQVIDTARDFFNLFFSHIVRWNKDIVKFERGVWVRIYGILIHAWNSSFFKLAVLDCGRFLRLDNCTVAKDRFDHARILLAMSSLEVINVTEKIVIDGVLVKVKIIEEWGLARGEDACLLDEEDAESKVSLPDNNYEEDFHDLQDNVNDLVNNLAEDWVEKEKETKCIFPTKNLVASKQKDGKLSSDEIYVN